MQSANLAADWLGPFVSKSVSSIKGDFLLYPWQKVALHRAVGRRSGSPESSRDAHKDLQEAAKALLMPKPFVFSAPTSGGKSMVAEILMIRELLGRRALRPDVPYKAIYVVPFQALAQEKAQDLRRRLPLACTRGGFGLKLNEDHEIPGESGNLAQKPLSYEFVAIPDVGRACGVFKGSVEGKGVAVTDFERSLQPAGLTGVSLSIRVGECFGRHSLRSAESCDVVVCTIEKASRWITQLAMQGRLSEIAAIVVDELDVVGRDTRGALIERLLGVVRMAGSEVQWPWPTTTTKEADVPSTAGPMMGTGSAGTSSEASAASAPAERSPAGSGLCAESPLDDATALRQPLELLTRVLEGLRGVSIRSSARSSISAETTTVGASGSARRPATESALGTGPARKRPRVDEEERPPDMAGAPLVSSTSVLLDPVQLRQLGLLWLALPVVPPTRINGPVEPQAARAADIGRAIAAAGLMRIPVIGMSATFCGALPHIGRWLAASVAMFKSRPRQIRRLILHRNEVQQAVGRSEGASLSGRPVVSMEPAGVVVPRPQGADFLATIPSEGCATGVAAAAKSGAGGQTGAVGRSRAPPTRGKTSKTITSPGTDAALLALLVSCLRSANGRLAVDAPRPQVLVFCPTRGMVEGFAQAIVKAAVAAGLEGRKGHVGAAGSAGSGTCPELTSLSQQIVRASESTARGQLAEQLHEAASSMDEETRVLLAVAARVGVTFHHARLPKSVKQKVIGAFKAGTVRCLCCTTTLSVGVNLPADVVILRRVHGWLGSSLAHRHLGAPKYCQIEGRCGRGKHKDVMAQQNRHGASPSAAEWLGHQPTTLVAVDRPQDKMYAEQLVATVAADGGGVTRENVDIGAVARHSLLVPNSVCRFLRGDCCADTEAGKSRATASWRTSEIEQTKGLGVLVGASGKTDSGQPSSNVTCHHEAEVLSCMEAESHPLSAFLLDVQLAGIAPVLRSPTQTQSRMSSRDLNRLRSCLLLGQECTAVAAQTTKDEISPFNLRLEALVDACSRRVIRLGLLQQVQGQDRRMAVALSASGVGLDAGVSMGRAALRLRARMCPHPVALLHLAVPDECIERTHPGAGETQLPVLHVEAAARLVRSLPKADRGAGLALHLHGIREDEVAEIGSELGKEENRYARSLTLQLHMAGSTGIDGPTSPAIHISSRAVRFRLGDATARRRVLLRAGWACFMFLCLAQGSDHDRVIHALRQLGVSTTSLLISRKSILEAARLVRRSCRGLARLYQQLGWADLERPMRQLAQQLQDPKRTDTASRLQQLTGCEPGVASDAAKLMVSLHSGGRNSQDAETQSPQDEFVGCARAVAAAYAFRPGRQPLLRSNDFGCAETVTSLSAIAQHFAGVSSATASMSRMVASLAKGSSRWQKEDVSCRARAAEPLNSGQVTDARGETLSSGNEMQPDAGLGVARGASSAPLVSAAGTSGGESLLLRPKDDHEAGAETDDSSVLSSAFADSSSGASSGSSVSSRSSLCSWQSESTMQSGESSMSDSHSEGSVSDEEGLAHLLEDCRTDEFDRDGALNDMTDSEPLNECMAGGAGGLASTDNVTGAPSQAELYIQAGATMDRDLASPCSSQLDREAIVPLTRQQASIIDSEGLMVGSAGESSLPATAPGLTRFLPWTASRSLLHGVSGAETSIPTSGRLSSTPRAPCTLQDAIRDTLDTLHSTLGRARGNVYGRQSSLTSMQSDDHPRPDSADAIKLLEAVGRPVIAVQVVLRALPAEASASRWFQIDSVASGGPTDENVAAPATVDAGAVMQTSAVAILWGLSRSECQVVSLPMARALPPYRSCRFHEWVQGRDGGAQPGETSARRPAGACWSMMPLSPLQTVMKFVGVLGALRSGRPTDQVPAVAASETCLLWRQAFVLAQRSALGKIQEPRVTALQKVLGYSGSVFVLLQAKSQLRWLAEAGLSVHGPLCDPVLGSRLLRQATWHDYDGGAPHLAALLQHCADLCADPNPSQPLAPSAGNVEALLRSFLSIATKGRLTSARPLPWHPDRTRVAGSSIRTREFVVVEGNQYSGAVVSGHGDEHPTGKIGAEIAARLVAQAALLCNAVLLPALRSLDLHRVFLLQEMPLQRALAAMETRGLALDMQRLRRLRGRTLVVLNAVRRDLEGLQTQQGGGGVSAISGAGDERRRHPAPASLSHLLTAKGAAEQLLQVCPVGVMRAAVARGLHAARAKLKISTAGRLFETQADTWRPMQESLRSAEAVLQQAVGADDPVPQVTRALRSRSTAYCLMAFGPPQAAIVLRAMVGVRSSLRVMWHASALLRATQWEPPLKAKGGSTAVAIPELTSCGPTGRIVASAPALQSLPKTIRLPRLASPSLQDMLSPSERNVRGVPSVLPPGSPVWVLDAVRLGQRLARDCQGRAAVGGQLSKLVSVPTGAERQAKAGQPAGETASSSRSSVTQPSSAQTTGDLQGPVLRRGVLVAVLAADRTPLDSIQSLAQGFRPGDSSSRATAGSVTAASSSSDPGCPPGSLAAYWQDRFVPLEGPLDAARVVLVALGGRGRPLPYPASAVYPAALGAAAAPCPPRLPGLRDMPQFGCARHWAVVDERPLLRGCVQARPGHVLVSVDFSAVELRLLAWLSGDSRLLGILRDAGADSGAAFRGVLRALGMPALGAGMEKAAAKTIVYGVVYGMGAQALAARLELSVAAARHVLSTFLGVFEGVRRLRRSAWRGAILSGGAVTTTGGRRRMVADAGRHAVRGRSARGRRRALSTLVQGTAADVMQRALLGLWRCIAGVQPGAGAAGPAVGGSMAASGGASPVSGPGKASGEGKGIGGQGTGQGPDFTDVWRGCRLLLPVHDEALLEVPAGREGAVAGAAAAVLQEAGRGLGVGVELPVRAAVGADWGALRLLRIYSKAGMAAAVGHFPATKLPIDS